MILENISLRETSYKKGDMEECKRGRKRQVKSLRTQKKRFKTTFERLFTAFASPSLPFYCILVFETVILSWKRYPLFFPLSLLLIIIHKYMIYPETLKAKYPQFPLLSVQPPSQGFLSSWIPSERKSQRRERNFHILFKFRLSHKVKAGLFKTWNRTTAEQKLLEKRIKLCKKGKEKEILFSKQKDHEGLERVVLCIKKGCEIRDHERKVKQKRQNK